MVIVKEVICTDLNQAWAEQCRGLRKDRGFKQEHRDGHQPELRLCFQTVATQGKAFFFLNFKFQNNYMFTESCKSSPGVSRVPISQFSFMVKILYSYGTMSKPANGHWYHPQTLFRFHPFPCTRLCEGMYV